MSPGSDPRARRQRAVQSSSDVPEARARQVLNQLWGDSAQSLNVTCSGSSSGSVYYLVVYFSSSGSAGRVRVQIVG